MADPIHSRGAGSHRVRWKALSFRGVALLFAARLITRRSRERATAPGFAPQQGARDVNSGVAFEPTDWSVGPVFLIYVGMLALLVIAAFVLIAAYPNSTADVSRRLRINPPGPRLQTNPEADMRRFRAEEEKRLNGYHWIDREKGVVHIPIEQAMQQLATRGIPGFPKASP